MEKSVLKHTGWLMLIVLAVLLLLNLPVSYTHLTLPTIA